jgi:predicted secreted protein
MIDSRGRVALVAYCILNQITRAWWGEDEVSRGEGMVSDFVGFLMRHGISTVQMGCPKFSPFDNPREPRSKEGYDKQEFIRNARR